MTIYSMLERWAKRCQESGLFDAFLDDSGDKTSTEANKNKSSVSRARAEKRQQVDMEIDTAIIDKQVANLLERAQAVRQQAKDYLSMGMSEMAKSQVNLYNQLYHKAVELKRKSANLALVGTQAAINQGIVEMAERVNGCLTAQDGYAERIKNAMDNIALTQMQTTRLDDLLDKIEMQNGMASEGVDELTLEDLQAEAANEIDAETNHSPLAEVMETQVDKS